VAVAIVDKQDPHQESLAAARAAATKASAAAS
jgi:hypothetical protein